MTLFDPEPTASALTSEGFARNEERALLSAAPPTLTDAHGRAIRYLRVSVTDRCDLRCTYCMAEKPRFLPRPEILSLEELDRVCHAFVRLGVRKIRVTGGEPLVRRDIMILFRYLSRHLASGALDEVTLTTNASQLAHHADALAACGVRRVNISLDTRNAETFRRITRVGNLDQIMAGIDAAQNAGLKIKINVVVLAGVNDHELSDMVAWCGDRGFDMTMIEVMPMGAIDVATRRAQFMALTDVRARLSRDWTLIDIPDRTGGPARYVRVAETGGRLGFITPLTGNFCDGCNRVRLTCTGVLQLCLGQSEHADLRAAVRASDDDGPLLATILAAMGRKPKGHSFVLNGEDRTGYTDRAMHGTGG